jgi:hypothetical protein
MAEGHDDSRDMANTVHGKPSARGRYAMHADTHAARNNLHACRLCAKKAMRDGQMPPGVLRGAALRVTASGIAGNACRYATPQQGSSARPCTQTFALSAAPAHACMPADIKQSSPAGPVDDPLP